MRWLAVAVALVSACPGPPSKTRGPEGPAIPRNFTPPPPLGGEPKADPAAPGHTWFDTIHPRFHERWADSFLEDCRVYLPPGHPLNDDKLAAQVMFDVDAKGEVSGIQVVKRSGNEDFDKTAMEVVSESAPFPAPPLELASDDGVVHVTWWFARDVRQDGIAGAVLDRQQWEPARAVPKLLKEGRLSDAAERVATAAEQGGDATRLVGLGRDVAGAALEAALGDGEADVRVAAARAIGAARWPGATVRLRTLATEAPDLRLQKAAMIALGQLGDTDAEAVLLTMLSTLDGDRSAAAASALAALGKGSAAWDKVSGKIRDDDKRVRSAALATVKELGEPTSAEGLGALLADKKASRQDRAAAAAALGVATGTDPAGAAAKALIAALADGDATVRAAAAWGIAAAGARGLRAKSVYYKVQPLLKDRDPRVRAGAAVASVRMWPDGGASDVALVCRKDRDPGVQLACAEGLAEGVGPDALETLLRFARGDAESIRLAALHGLALRSEPEAKQAVAAVSADSDARLRALAASAETDRAKLEAALEDGSPEVRAAAVVAYVKAVGAAGALPKAVRAVGDGGSVAARVSVAQAFLSATGEPAAVR